MKAKNIVIISILLLISVSVKCETALNKLDNKNDFDKLSGLPLSGKYGQISSVKVVYDIHAKKLYFLNSKLFKFHYEFCLSNQRSLTSGSVRRCQLSTLTPQSSHLISKSQHLIERHIITLLRNILLLYNYNNHLYIN